MSSQMQTLLAQKDGMMIVNQILNGPGGSSSNSDAVATAYGFPSLYATVKESEDFAESMTAFFLRPQEVEKINPQKYHYFQNLLARPL
jgi:hypothetical protein